MVSYAVLCPQACPQGESAPAIIAYPTDGAREIAHLTPRLEIRWSGNRPSEAGGVRHE